MTNMKPGTFTQMYVQHVFAVKNRDAVLKEDFRERVLEYMSGIVSNLKHKSIIINGTSNHVHILFGLNPSVSVSDTRDRI
jgi:REP element-mobilizing transposase RayT